jgi:hypothetical protein
MGALCAGKESRGGMDFVRQLASLKLEFGVITNCAPVLKVASLIDVGSHTVKQVGYPYQSLFGFVGSPTRKGLLVRMDS